MNRQQKIELIRSISEGKISPGALKEQQPYIFERIGESKNYKDKLSGRTMSLNQINDLPEPLNPHWIGRLNLIDNEGKTKKIRIIPERI